MEDLQDGRREFVVSSLSADSELSERLHLGRTAWLRYKVTFLPLTPGSSALSDRETNNRRLQLSATACILANQPRLQSQDLHRAGRGRGGLDHGEPVND